MKPCAWCGADIERAYRHRSMQERAKFCGMACYRLSLRRSYVSVGLDRAFVITPSGRSVISACDIAFAKRFSWAIDSQGYLGCHSGRFHRLLLSPAQGFYVDHINRDNLDNRRENLRIVRPAVNVRNCKTHATNTSGHRGVSWDRHSRRWFSYIGVNNQRVRLGLYADLSDAITARLEAESNLWGTR